MWRLFLAVPLTDAVVEAIEAVTAQVRDHVPPRSVRWTRAGQHHLTVRFLGDTDPERVDELSTSLAAMARGARPMTPTLADVGAFPDRGDPAVLWVGLRGDDNLHALTAWQAHIEQQVQALGWPAESRPYRPHLTLGRVRRGVRLGSSWRQVSPPAIPVPISELRLMRSELASGGARYTTLQTASVPCA